MHWHRSSTRQFRTTAKRYQLHLTHKLDRESVGTQQVSAHHWGVQPSCELSSEHLLTSGALLGLICIRTAPASTWRDGNAALGLHVGRGRAGIGRVCSTDRS